MPDDHYLLSAEADLARFLSQTNRLLNTLEKAFRANPNNIYGAISYARAKLGASDLNGAETVVRKALEYNEHEPRLHYLLSKILFQSGNSSPSDLLFHLKRSFTPGDRNFDAQLMHARQVYIMSGAKEALPYFNELSKAKATIEEKRQHHFPLEQEFFGRVMNLLSTACFIKSERNLGHLYAHESSFVGEDWDNLAYDTRVEFSIAFNFKGPVATNIRIVD